MTSTIKVDNIQNQCGANIINESSNTITIGASGDTVTLASGASQTGFGRTGTVDWQTGSIKTATFTAANGEGYFANTSGGAFTMNLPAGTAGNIVSVVDYTNTFQTNGLTIAANGSQKIGGVAAPTTLTTEGQSVTFVYVDDTEGWKNVQDSTSNVKGNPFIVATGGTITTSGDCKIHTFNSPGTFTVTNAGSPCGSNTVNYLVVGGGGGGQGAPTNGAKGGGGAGGHRSNYPAPATGGLSVTAQAYSIDVGGGGAGGTGSPSNGANGSVSTFSTITSAGGGLASAGPGGSGGGGDFNAPSGGTGNTPPVSPPQGNNGATGTVISGGNTTSGGGGGAGGAGSAGSPSPNPARGGNGGDGAANSISGSPVTRAGGGSGTGEAGPGIPNPYSAPGGGGAGDGSNGGTNLGGGGGARTGGGAGNGGSGVVIIRYKFQ